MPKRPKIGEYRHSPGTALRAGADGVLRPEKIRRRFRHLGFVVLAYAVVGPLGCAATSWLLSNVAHGAWVPRAVEAHAGHRSPTWDNVLFGAGAPEVGLASALLGYGLWQCLWPRQATAETASGDARALFRSLIGPGVALGSVFSVLGMFIGLIGLYVRTGPAAQPWFVRLAFAPVAAVVMAVDYVFTAVVPVTLLCLGMAAGVLTASAVAMAWKSAPEESVHR